MTTTPLPIDQFAASIRGKYPGKYDSLSDPELVNAVVTKYPQYKPHVASYDKTEFEQEHQDPGVVEGAKEALGKGPAPTRKGTLKDPETYLGPAAGVAKNLSSIPGNLRRGWENAEKLGIPKWDVPERAMVAASHAVGPFVGISPEAQEEAAGRGATGEVLGQALVPAALAAAHPAWETTRGAREIVGGKIRTPEGELKPNAKIASQAGGAVAGGAGTFALGHSPWYGGVAGYKLGPSIMESMFPEPRARVAAREAAASHELFAKNVADVEAARQKELAANERLKEQWARAVNARKGEEAPPPSPFGNATSTATTSTGPQPSFTPREGPPAPTTVPGLEPKLEVTGKGFAKPAKVEKSPIYDPESPEPGHKVTFQSVRRPDLVETIRSKDTPYETRMQAIRELQRSPAGTKILEQIPGVRFMIESGSPAIGHRPYDLRGNIETGPGMVPKGSRATIEPPVEPPKPPPEPQVFAPAEKFGKPVELAPFELGKDVPAAKTATSRARTPNKAMMKDIGLTLRGEFPQGYYDFQDVQTGGTIALKKEGFTEQALRDKVKAHRQAMAATSAEGKSDLAAEKAKNAQERFATATEEAPKEAPKESSGLKAVAQEQARKQVKRQAVQSKPFAERYTPEEVEEAKLLANTELGMMESGDKPGRYHDEYEYEAGKVKGEKGTGFGQVRGVKRMTHLPLMDQFKESPAQVSAALKRGKGALYERVIDKAVELMRSEKENEGFRFGHNIPGYEGEE